MKKLATHFALVFCTAMLQAQAPCQNDPQYANNPPGIYNLGLPVATSNQSFSYVYQLGTDTGFVWNMTNVHVKAERICDISGVPGLVAAPNYNDPNGSWLNGSGSVQGCILISISQQDINAALGVNDSVMLPITITIDAYIKGNPIPATYTWLSTLGTPPCGASLVYYDTLKIMRLAPVTEIQANTGFSIQPSYPNPFSGSTQINYTTVKEEPIAFTVFDVLGKKVYQQNYHSNSGPNSIVFNADNLTSGVYTYTLSNGKHAFTRKMLIE